jgi:hypothetical protein
MQEHIQKVCILYGGILSFLLTMAVLNMGLEKRI